MSADEPMATIVLIVDGASETVLARLSDRTERGLALVDVLARAQLRAKRLGCAIRVANPCPEVAGLLELVGLADVLLGGGPCSVDQACWQPEGGEQLGLQEAVDAADPPP